MLCCRLIPVLVLAVLPMTAAAGGFSRGDVLIVTEKDAASGDCFPVHTTLWIKPAGETAVRVLRRMNFGDPTLTSIVWSPAESAFLGLTWSTEDTVLVRIETDGSLTPLASLGDSFFYGLVVDRAGNAYTKGASYAHGSFQYDFMLKVGLDGSQSRIHFPAGVLTTPSVYALDLAADQCTLYLGQGGALPRFNLCTGQILPSFVQDDFTQSFRILPDNGLLASVHYYTGRYDAEGHRVSTWLQTYGDHEEPNVLALDSDNVTFWMVSDWSCHTLDPSRLYHVRLDDGSLVSDSLPLGDDDEGRAVAIAGEWRAATQQVRRRLVGH